MMESYKQVSDETKKHYIPINQIFNMIDLLNIGGQLHGRSAITFGYLGQKAHSLFLQLFLCVLAVRLRLFGLLCIYFSFKISLIVRIRAVHSWRSSVNRRVEMFKWNGISISFLNIITYKVKIWLHIRKFRSGLFGCVWRINCCYPSIMCIVRSSWFFFFFFSSRNSIEFRNHLVSRH